PTLSKVCACGPLISSAICRWLISTMEQGSPASFSRSKEPRSDPSASCPISSCSSGPSHSAACFALAVLRHGSLAMTSPSASPAASMTCGPPRKTYRVACGSMRTPGLAVSTGEVRRWVRSGMQPSPLRVMKHRRGDLYRNIAVRHGHIHDLAERRPPAAHHAERNRALQKGAVVSGSHMSDRPEGRLLARHRCELRAFFEQDARIDRSEPHELLPIGDAHRGTHQ